MSTFNVGKFLEKAGSRLVEAFDESGMATTPSTIGTAREHSAREEISELLGSAVRVGEGFVIDSHGSTSQQQDILISETVHGPVFSIVGSAAASHIPCEIVFSCGEVKSALNKKSLFDIMKKTWSVKNLVRHSEVDPNGLLGSTYCYRNLGSTAIVDGGHKGYDQGNQALDQVFCFAIAGTNELSKDKML